MYMNRISPKTSELYICDSDGSDERSFLQESVFDYHASYSPDGKWVLFTTERNGLGNADVYRARPDGSGISAVATGPHIEDAAAMSPDGAKVAFVCSRDGYRANVWAMDLKTHGMRNVTAKAFVRQMPRYRTATSGRRGRRTAARWRFLRIETPTGEGMTHPTVGSTPRSSASM